METQSKLLSQVITLQQTLMQLQSENHSLLNLKHEAEQLALELQAKLAERSRYELYELAPGKLVYAPKPDANDAQPAHYLCQNCYDKGIKSVLRRIGPSAHDSQISWMCAERGEHNLHI